MFSAFVIMVLMADLISSVSMRRFGMSLIVVVNVVTFVYDNKVSDVHLNHASSPPSEVCSETVTLHVTL